MRVRALLLSAGDSVVVLVEAGRKGDVAAFSSGELTLLADVPMGHKVARGAIGTGGVVLKYGEPIGVASRPIRAGEHVHVHNLDSVRAGGSRHGP